MSVERDLMTEFNGDGGYSKREKFEMSVFPVVALLLNLRAHSENTCTQTHLKSHRTNAHCSWCQNFEEKNSFCARARHRACERCGQCGNREASRVFCAGGAGAVCADGQWHTAPGPISNRALCRLNCNALPREICPFDALFVSMPKIN